MEDGRWKTQGQCAAEVYLLFVAVRVVAVSDCDVAFDVVADFDIDRAAVKT